LVFVVVVVLVFLFVFLSLFFEKCSHCVAQTDLELTILLPQPMECWDYRLHHQADSLRVQLFIEHTTKEV
jgi:hypothetical protein